MRRRAPKPVSHSYRACALGPVFHSWPENPRAGAPQQETPGYHKRKAPLPAPNQRKARRVPTRLKLTPEDMKEQTYKVVKKSLTPSRIGVVLRDSHSVTQYIL
ncbi:hypothetical protein R6Z07M_001172 [Ovis aries]